MLWYPAQFTYTTFIHRIPITVNLVIGISDVSRLANTTVHLVLSSYQSIETIQNNFSQLFTNSTVISPEPLPSSFDSSALEIDKEEYTVTNHSCIHCSHPTGLVLPSVHASVPDGIDEGKQYSHVPCIINNVCHVEQWSPQPLLYGNYLSTLIPSSSSSSSLNNLTLYGGITWYSANTRPVPKFCICGEYFISHGSSTMMECERCKDWFHEKCLRNKDTDVDHFLCPRCRVPGYTPSPELIKRNIRNAERETGEMPRSVYSRHLLPSLFCTSRILENLDDNKDEISNTIEVSDTEDNTATSSNINTTETASTMINSRSKRTRGTTVTKVDKQRTVRQTRNLYDTLKPSSSSRTEEIAQPSLVMVPIPEAVFNVREQNDIFRLYSRVREIMGETGWLQSHGWLPLEQEFTSLAPASTYTIESTPLKRYICTNSKNKILTVNNEAFSGNDKGDDLHTFMTPTFLYQLRIWSTELSDYFKLVGSVFQTYPSVNSFDRLSSVESPSALPKVSLVPAITLLAKYYTLPIPFNATNRIRFGSMLPPSYSKKEFADTLIPPMVTLNNHTVTSLDKPILPLVTYMDEYEKGLYDSQSRNCALRELTGVYIEKYKADYLDELGDRIPANLIALLQDITKSISENIHLSTQTFLHHVQHFTSTNTGNIGTLELFLRSVGDYLEMVLFTVHYLEHCILSRYSIKLPGGNDPDLPQFIYFEASKIFPATFLDTVFRTLNDSINLCPLQLPTALLNRITNLQHLWILFERIAPREPLSLRREKTIGFQRVLADIRKENTENLLFDSYDLDYHTVRAMDANILIGLSYTLFPNIGTNTVEKAMLKEIPIESLDLYQSNSGTDYSQSENLTNLYRQLEEKSRIYNCNLPIDLTADNSRTENDKDIQYDIYSSFVDMVLRYGLPRSKFDAQGHAVGSLTDYETNNLTLYAGEFPFGWSYFGIVSSSVRQSFHYKPNERNLVYLLSQFCRHIIDIRSIVCKAKLFYKHCIKPKGKANQKDKNNKLNPWELQTFLDETHNLLLTSKEFLYLDYFTRRYFLWINSIEDCIQKLETYEKQQMSIKHRERKSYDDNNGDNSSSSLVSFTKHTTEIEKPLNRLEILLKEKHTYISVFDIEDRIDDADKLYSRLSWHRRIALLESTIRQRLMNNVSLNSTDNRPSMEDILAILAEAQQLDIETSENILTSVSFLQEVLDTLNTPSVSHRSIPESSILFPLTKRPSALGTNTFELSSDIMKMYQQIQRNISFSSSIVSSVPNGSTNTDNNHDNSSSSSDSNGLYTSATTIDELLMYIDSLYGSIRYHKQTMGRQLLLWQKLPVIVTEEKYCIQLIKILDWCLTGITLLVCLLKDSDRKRIQSSSNDTVSNVPYSLEFVSFVNSLSKAVVTKYHLWNTLTTITEEGSAYQFFFTASESNFNSSTSSLLQLDNATSMIVANEQGILIPAGYQLYRILSSIQSFVSTWQPIAKQLLFSIEQETKAIRSHLSIVKTNSNTAIDLSRDNVSSSSSSYPPMERLLELGHSLSLIDPLIIHHHYRMYRSYLGEIDIPESLQMVPIINELSEFDNHIHRLLTENFSSIAKGLGKQLIEASYKAAQYYLVSYLGLGFRPPSALLILGKCVGKIIHLIHQFPEFSKRLYTFNNNGNTTENITDVEKLYQQLRKIRDNLRTYFTPFVTAVPAWEACIRLLENVLQHFMYSCQLYIQKNRSSVTYGWPNSIDSALDSMKDTNNSVNNNLVQLIPFVEKYTKDISYTETRTVVDTVRELMNNQGSEWYSPEIMDNAIETSTNTGNMNVEEEPWIQEMNRPYRQKILSTGSRMSSSVPIIIANQENVWGCNYYLEYERIHKLETDLQETERMNIKLQQLIASMITNTRNEFVSFPRTEITDTLLSCGKLHFLPELFLPALCTFIEQDFIQQANRVLGTEIGISSASAALMDIDTAVNVYENMKLFIEYVQQIYPPRVSTNTVDTVSNHPQVLYTIGNEYSSIYTVLEDRVKDGIRWKQQYRTLYSAVVPFVQSLSHVSTSNLAKELLSSPVTRTVHFNEYRTLQTDVQRVEHWENQITSCIQTISPLIGTLTNSVATSSSSTEINETENKLRKYTYDLCKLVISAGGFVDTTTVSTTSLSSPISSSFSTGTPRTLTESTTTLSSFIHYIQQWYSFSENFTRSAFWLYAVQQYVDNTTLTSSLSSSSTTATVSPLYLPFSPSSSVVYSLRSLLHSIDIVLSLRYYFHLASSESIQYSFYTPNNDSFIKVHPLFPSIVSASSTAGNTIQNPPSTMMNIEAINYRYQYIPKVTYTELSRLFNQAKTVFGSSYVLPPLLQYVDRTLQRANILRKHVQEQMMSPTGTRIDDALIDRLHKLEYCDIEETDYMENAILYKEIKDTAPWRFISDDNDRNKMDTYTGTTDEQRSSGSTVKESIPEKQRRLTLRWIKIGNYPFWPGMILTESDLTPDIVQQIQESIGSKSSGSSSSSTVCKVFGIHPYHHTSSSGITTNNNSKGGSNKPLYIRITDKQLIRPYGHEDDQVPNTLPIRSIMYQYAIEEAEEYYRTGDTVQTYEKYATIIQNGSSNYGGKGTMVVPNDSVLYSGALATPTTTVTTNIPFVSTGTILSERGNEGLKKPESIITNLPPQLTVPSISSTSSNTSVQPVGDTNPPDFSHLPVIQRAKAIAQWRKNQALITERNASSSSSTTTVPAPVTTTEISTVSPVQQFTVISTVPSLPTSLTSTSVQVKDTIPVTASTSIPSASFTTDLFSTFLSTGSVNISAASNTTSSTSGSSLSSSTSTAATHVPHKRKISSAITPNTSDDESHGIKKTKGLSTTTGDGSDSDTLVSTKDSKRSKKKKTEKGTEMLPKGTTESTKSSTVKSSTVLPSTTLSSSTLRPSSLLQGRWKVRNTFRTGLCKIVPGSTIFITHVQQLIRTLTGTSLSVDDDQFPSAETVLHRYVTLHPIDMNVLILMMMIESITTDIEIMLHGRYSITFASNDYNKYFRDIYMFLSTGSSVGGPGVSTVVSETDGIGTLIRNRLLSKDIVPYQLVLRENNLPRLREECSKLYKSEKEKQETMETTKKQEKMTTTINPVGLGGNSTTGAVVRSRDSTDNNRDEIPSEPLKRSRIDHHDTVSSGKDTAIFPSLNGNEETEEDQSNTTNKSVSLADYLKQLQGSSTITSSTSSSRTDGTNTSLPTISSSVLNSGQNPSVQLSLLPLLRTINDHNAMDLTEQGVSNIFEEMHHNVTNRSTFYEPTITGISGLSSGGSTGSTSSSHASSHQHRSKHDKKGEKTSTLVSSSLSSSSSSSTVSMDRPGVLHTIHIQSTTNNIVTDLVCSALRVPSVETSLPSRITSFVSISSSSSSSSHRYPVLRHPLSVVGRLPPEKFLSHVKEIHEQSKSRRWFIFRFEVLPQNTDDELFTEWGNKQRIGVAKDKHSDENIYIIPPLRYYTAGLSTSSSSSSSSSSNQSSINLLMNTVHGKGDYGYLSTVYGYGKACAEPYTEYERKEDEFITRYGYLFLEFDPMKHTDYE